MCCLSDSSNKRSILKLHIESTQHPSGEFLYQGGGSEKIFTTLWVVSGLSKIVLHMKRCGENRKKNKLDCHWYIVVLSYTKPSQTNITSSAMALWNSGLLLSVLEQTLFEFDRA